LMIASTVSFGKKADKTYTGEIMDSTCAKMGNHDAGYKLTGTNTPKDCTLACVKSGAKFVLYDASKKTTYELDDQDKAKDLAGQKVNVEGVRAAKYTVDGGARGMREVFRSASWPPRLWA